MGNWHHHVLFAGAGKAPNPGGRLGHGAVVPSKAAEPQLRVQRPILHPVQGFVPEVVPSVAHLALHCGASFETPVDNQELLGPHSTNAI